MSICRITEQISEKIAFLFDGWQETLIWSCLQGYMGAVFTDNAVHPASAQIVIADFCFFAGRPNKELVKNRPAEYTSDFVIMVPQNEEWSELIEATYHNITKATRYAIKKETDVFDKEYLHSIVKNINNEYEIKLIDETIYHMAKQNRWSADLCSQFKDYESYQKNGLGAAALYHGELVSGASSYTIYRDGIEIEIDTREDHRRKGLALACGAKLILACLDRNLYPSWDAQNKASVALAEKLGYHFDHAYCAYEVYDF